MHVGGGVDEDMMWHHGWLFILGESLWGFCGYEGFNMQLVQGGSKLSNVESKSSILKDSSIFAISNTRVNDLKETREDIHFFFFILSLQNLSFDIHFWFIFLSFINFQEYASGESLGAKSA